MATQLDSEQINQLIAEKRYEEAKNILRQSAAASAKQWLDNLERQFPVSTSDDWRFGSESFLDTRYQESEESIKPRRANSGRGFQAPIIGSSVTAPVKGRGLFLTVWLIFLMIADPLLAIYYLANAHTLTYSYAFVPRPLWVVPCFVVFGITNGICAFGIWRWKKWGAYGLLAGGIILEMLALIFYGVNAGSTGAFFGICLMANLLKNRWHLFN